LNKDFTPLSISSSEKLSGKLVFAGYGISYPDSNYDDYKNIDVKDKLVMIFNGIPNENSPKNKFSKFRNNRIKAMIARDKGAKGIIVFSGYDESDDKLIKLKYDMGSSSSGIVAVNITRNLAEEIFRSEGQDLKEIQHLINSTLEPRSFELKNTSISFQTDIQEIKEKSFNVLGLLEGNNPKLKDQFIIIGAHYDHLGKGGESSLAPDIVAVHGGADDNASGTAGLLELAQSLSMYKERLGRSLLFIAFSGEEEGLLGSGYYVKNPIIPLEKTVAMINMDMIGRLKDKKLIVNGAGSAKIFGELLNKYNTDSLFNLRMTDDGFSPSDNSSFFGKNIPVMMFFTDLHLDYHKPSDTWDKINAEGEKNVLDLVRNVIVDLSNVVEKPEFIKPKVSANAGKDMPGFSVRTGIIPQFGEEVEGVKIQGAKEGSPAAYAGLKAGDIIIKLGNNTIKNLYDYTFALSNHKPGEKVIIIWIRDGKQMSNELEFGKR
jgi:hypothetical protein